MSGKSSRGDFIEVNGGATYFPFDPDPDVMTPERIAHALAMQNRYGGHCKFGWSVASHSCAMTFIVPEEYRFLALMHDADEAFIPDLASPIKYSPGMEEYRRLGQEAWCAVAYRYGIPEELPEIIHIADKAMVWWESRALMDAGAPWWSRFEQYASMLPKPPDIVPVTWEQAESEWLRLFALYSGE